MTQDPPNPQDAPSDPPAELIEQVRRLMERERSGERATLMVGPMAAYVLIGVIQLATRQPYTHSTHRELLRGLARQLEPLFADTPLEESIQQGYDPANDR